MELFGAHGTTKARVSKIRKEGFLPGKRGGKAGVGVYFWAYENTPDVAIALARNWWEWASGEGWYKRDTDHRCAVVLSTLKLDNEENFFDCGDTYFQERLYEVAHAQGVTSPKDVASLYDSVLADLEEELGEEFVVTKLYVPVPTPRNRANERLLVKLLYSNYPSYRVRKNHSEVIEITDSKYF